MAIVSCKLHVQECSYQGNVAKLHVFLQVVGNHVITSLSGKSHGTIPHATTHGHIPVAIVVNLTFVSIRWP